MSVYIHGMEMPTLYRTYKVRFAKSDDGKIIVGIANEDSTAYRPIGEAIPVPPHGRLIDADALKDAIDSTDWYHQVPSKDMVLGANSAEHQAWYKWQDINAAVYNAPTIIPADPVEVDNG